VSNLLPNKQKKEKHFLALSGLMINNLIEIETDEWLFRMSLADSNINIKKSLSG
jgi:hypothetical protein